jgi:hypothetical protein
MGTMYSFGMGSKQAIKHHHIDGSDGKNPDNPTCDVVHCLSWATYGYDFIYEYSQRNLAHK